MSDRFHASLEIGGPISRDLIPALAAQISDAGLICAGEALEQHLDDSGLLVLEDEQAAFGEFPELEAWLEEHGFEYDRNSSGYFDLLPEWVSFRHGQGRIIHLLDSGGEEVISHRDIQQALAASTSLPVLRAALATILGPEVPPLKPINIKENRTP